MSATAVAPGHAPVTLAGDAVHMLAVELIDRNPYQTRSYINETSLEELAASIKASGVLQPITVRPLPEGRYQLITGERRWLASQKAGKASIPAIVRQASNEQAMEMTIVENLQREDLNPMEEARAFERLSKEFGLTQEQIAIRTGKERGSIANFLRLTRLPSLVQRMIEKGELTMGHAKAIMALDSESGITQMAERIRAQAMSVRQTEEYVDEILHPVMIHMQPREKELDPNVRAAQKQLERALGVKVTVTDKKGKGKILIEYASLEDFDRIVEALTEKKR
jgi:ParB family chromosome partitioning protein